MTSDNAERPTRVQLAAAGWYPAKKPGVCVRCSKVFYTGHLIYPDGMSTYLAECCGVIPAPSPGQRRKQNRK